LWDTTHSYSSHASVTMWHVPFILYRDLYYSATWLVRTLKTPLSQCDMPHSDFWHNSVPVRHDSFIMHTK